MFITWFFFFSCRNEDKHFQDRWFRSIAFVHDNLKKKREEKIVWNKAVNAPRRGRSRIILLFVTILSRGSNRTHYHNRYFVSIMKRYSLSLSLRYEMERPHTFTRTSVETVARLKFSPLPMSSFVCSIVVIIAHKIHLYTRYLLFICLWLVKKWKCFHSFFLLHSLHLTRVPLCICCNPLSYISP